VVPPTPYAFEPHRLSRSNSNRISALLNGHRRFSLTTRLSSHTPYEPASALSRGTRPADLLFRSPPVRSRASPPMPTTASSSSAQPVRVVLRVRPFLPSEAASAGTPCVSLIGGYPGREATVQLKDQYTRCATSVNLPLIYQLASADSDFPRSPVWQFRLANLLENRKK
jgi:kinesin family member 22